MATGNMVASGILQALDAEGGRLYRRSLPRKLRDLGIASSYYSRAAALVQLEFTGMIRREMQGRDSRGFRTELVVCTHGPTTAEHPAAAQKAIHLTDV